MKYILTLLSLLTVLPTITHSQEPPHLYTTGTAMEIDRCASAWLIKRFVDKKAVFKFYPENSLITKGIVFDRPEGNHQRTHNAATFEVILKKYEISESRLNHMAEFIHDIEINFWGNKKNPESGKIKAILQKKIDSSSSNDELFAICFDYLDGIFSKLPTQTIQ